MNSTTYTPPDIWQPPLANGGQFANINRPTAGATHEKELPVGRHPLQLYSLGTPNGVKVTVMLEELLAAGHSGGEYDAWLIRINQGEQFGAFLPRDTANRTECLSWLFWQMGSAPFLGGGFGHFYMYAPTKIEYAIDRYAMEAKRQLDVLDQRLAHHAFIAGDDYTIADMAIWPWYGQLALGQIYGNAAHFLQTQQYKHLQRWATQMAQRPAVKRGRMVNRTTGELAEQLHERHTASDFDTRTQDKVDALN